MLCGDTESTMTKSFRQFATANPKKANFFWFLLLLLPLIPPIF
jgi:hypothetical protein